MFMSVMCCIIMINANVLYLVHILGFYSINQTHKHLTIFRTLKIEANFKKSSAIFYHTEKFLLHDKIYLIHRNIHTFTQSKTLNDVVGLM